MVEYVVVLQPRRNTFGLGSIRFRSPLLTESISLSFPPLTEMFHFSGFCVSYPMYSGMYDQVLPRSGYPIRIPPDHRLLAASRGFSQLAASFFACWHQGIHRTPLFSSSYRKSLYLLQYHKVLSRLAVLSYFLVCMFYIVVVVVLQLPTLLEINCFSAIVSCHADVNFRLVSYNQFSLVGLTGLEPVTPRLSSACSNQLSYRPGLIRVSTHICYNACLFPGSCCSKTGGGTGTRTPDIQLAKLALYQLSYTPSCGSV